MIHLNQFLSYRLFYYVIMTIIIKFNSINLKFFNLVILFLFNCSLIELSSQGFEHQNSENENFHKLLKLLLVIKYFIIIMTYIYVSMHLLQLCFSWNSNSDMGDIISQLSCYLIMLNTKINDFLILFYYLCL
jgi:hypothetical protein